MTWSDLKGKVPVPRSSTSSKFVVLAGVLGLLMIGAIIFGFRKRVVAKQERLKVQNTATVASDAAMPPKLPPATQVPVTTTGTSVSAAVPGTTATGTLYQMVDGVLTPVVGAVNTVAHPFPGQAQSQYTPAYVPPTIVSQDQSDLRTFADREAKRVDQLREKLLAQMEAPTGIAGTGQSRAAVAPSAQDSVSAELARLTSAANAASRVSSAPDQQQNQVPDKDRFAQVGDGENGGYLKTTRVPSLNKFVVQRGWRIPATLAQQISSDLLGDLIATVERPVFDTATGRFLLIPAGSRLVGEYNSHVTYGQKSVQVAWTAIYFKDGSHIELGRMPAQSASGSAGLHDQVDNHIKRLVGGVALSSVLAAGLSISQNRSSSGSVLQYPSTGQQAASAIGQQAVESGMQLTNRNLNVAPTLKIRPGELFSVFVERDIIFPGPYLETK